MGFNHGQLYGRKVWLCYGRFKRQHWGGLNSQGTVNVIKAMDTYQQKLILKRFYLFKIGFYECLMDKAICSPSPRGSNFCCGAFIGRRGEIIINCNCVFAHGHGARSDECQVYLQKAMSQSSQSMQTTQDWGNCHWIVRSTTTTTSSLGKKVPVSEQGTKVEGIDRAKGLRFAKTAKSNNRKSKKSPNGTGTTAFSRTLRPT